MTEEKPTRQGRYEVKQVIEALLFATADPLPLNKIRAITDDVFPLSPTALKELIEDLKQEYEVQQRAFCLEEIAEGYQLRSKSQFAPYLARLGRSKRTERLSQAATEVLAIIAYKQPITRPQIDAIRGVDSSSLIHNLNDRGLIETRGKLDVPGRPTLFGTTPAFLEHFGLKNLSSIPQSKLSDSGS